MYSLVSSAVLAMDLARHPSGVAVADAVDRALALTDDEISRMGQPANDAARHDGTRHDAAQQDAAQQDATRRRVLDACKEQPRMSTLMGGVAATVAEGLPSSDHSRTIVQALNETLVGGLEDLLDMLERELPEQAVQTAQDGVTVAWAGREAALSDLAALNAPWKRALDPVPPALVGPSYRLQVLLDQISTRTRQQWQRTADAHGAHRGRLQWSTAMHEACQAAFEHDRLTDVARAQLAAARQLRLSGASTGEDAHAIGMAVTAAVQATCLEDVLESHVTYALLGAWEAGS